MKQFLLLAWFLMSCVAVFSQTATVKGKVTDLETNEGAIGALVQFSPELKAKTDIDGLYTIENVPYGKYTVTVSMATYETKTVSVTIGTENQTIDLVLGSEAVLEEVKVVANLVQDRKTPVAVSNLDKKEIVEELGSQDLPMILNSKPGVHATQQGGGDGDARITIRGFDQRNVGMMIDGVPVNDMENGWVYWSNWFGLDNITQQIQVQRGLGATKLAMPSVGGTMNIITENAFGKPEVKIQQEYGSGNFFRTSLSYKSGMLKNGWGFVMSASYKQGNGWVDGLYTQGGFYYLKVQKKFKNHVLSLSGFGAPQQHAQRSYNQKIGYWDADYAAKLGIDTAGSRNMGIRYNAHYGYYTDADGKQKIMAERRNYYHKPQITLRDFWKINDKVSWTNTAYMSIGRGGGERAFNSSSITYNSDNTIDWDQIIRNNQEIEFFGTKYPSIDAAYSATELKSTQVLASMVNNHMWIGGVSQVDYKINQYFNFAGGVDYRWYKGEHYTEITNLLGGDYFVNNQNQNVSTSMMREGDKIGWEPYHNHRDALMQWVGGFAQVEFEKGRWTAFANVSVVANSYKGIDYFQKKELHVDDTIIYIGANDPSVKYDDKIYSHSSKELKFNQTETLWLTGFTVKGGANFNVTERSNIFLNVGYLDRTPMFNNVIDNNTNKFFEEILNEKIYAFEAGYGFRSKKISVNANGYFTMWQNKPFPFGVNVPDPQDPGSFIRANVNGMDALHMGIEVDAAYNITKTLTLEGMVSYGDWTWQSSETIDVVGTKFQFDAKGVHVGDAAQSVYAASVRWEFVKNAYVKLKYTYFDRYYSNFDPFSLTGANGGKDSWKIPGYGLLTAHAGYKLKFQKSALDFRINVFNVLNTTYISDARNNQNGNNFDATSAGVFFGMGTTFNASIAYEF
jgi:iron complex outermembrane receptor protein